MEKQILAAIAEIGGFDQSPVPPEALRARLKSIAADLVRMVKKLADQGLIEIDEDSGYLQLTAAGSAKVAADEPPRAAREPLPPIEPVRSAASLPDPRPKRPNTAPKAAGKAKPAVKKKAAPKKRK